MTDNKNGGEDKSFEIQIIDEGEGEKMDRKYEQTNRSNIDCNVNKK